MIITFQWLQVELIKKNGKRVPLRYEFGVTTTTGSETGDTIRAKLGAASALNDGYLRKEDFILFSSGSAIGADMDFGTAANPTLSIDFGHT